MAAYTRGKPLTELRVVGGRALGRKGISAVEVGELLAGICEPRKLEAGEAHPR